jgi:hypothetical protein
MNLILIMKMVQEQEFRDNKTHKVLKENRHSKKQKYLRKSKEHTNFNGLSTFTFHIMNSPCNALITACPLVATHPSTIPHFFCMNVDDHLLNNFSGYLLDEK